MLRGERLIVSGADIERALALIRLSPYEDVLKPMPRALICAVSLYAPMTPWRVLRGRPLLLPPSLLLRPR